jgi:hypothetical protein
MPGWNGLSRYMGAAEKTALTCGTGIRPTCGTLIIGRGLYPKRVQNDMPVVSACGRVLATEGPRQKTRIRQMRDFPTPVFFP